MGEERVIHAALLGLGTVGGGVYKLAQRRKREMMAKAGCRLSIDRILVRNARRIRDGVDNDLLTDRWEDVLNDDQIEIVIEVMGGIEPAKTYIEQALRSGKHVVTANKDLMAVHGQALFQLAKEHGCNLMLEAAVAGGIPVIQPLRESLAGNEIDEVMGIVNGTTNYILTRMNNDGMEFEAALAKATELGYAEADPTADVEGLDAARKLAILATMAFHSEVTFDDVFAEGITRITATDIEYAKAMDRRIKLLAVAHNTPEGIEVGVYPMLIPSSHPLASVSDSFNAVFVHGDAVGDVMFYGRGAGELPTASAVLGDTIRLMRQIVSGSKDLQDDACYRQLSVKSPGDVANGYFLRMKVKDRPGTLAQIASVFGQNQVSIHQVIQQPAKKNIAELVVITDRVQEKHMHRSLSDLSAMDIVYEISSVIRVYGQ